MKEDDAFLQAIITAPDDDGLRLIYADWLEEHGLFERAEFIRVQIEVARLPEGAPRRGELQDREQELLERHGGEWAGSVRGLVKNWYFRRGFVEDIELAAEDFLTHAAVISSHAPIRHAEFRCEWPHAPDALIRLGACPHLARLESISLSFSFCRTRDELQALASSPPLLERLESLFLLECDLGEAGLGPVLLSSPLGRLRGLYLSDCGLRGEGGVRPLAESTQLSVLTHLTLDKNALGDRGVRALAASPNCGRLVSLDLGDCDVTDLGAEALARSPHLGRLEWLYLYGNRVTHRGVRALAYSRQLGQLRSVFLAGNRIGKPDEGWLKARFGGRVRF
jgi:uncharacterized protein (TIGR02996 family)